MSIARPTAACRGMPSATSDMYKRLTTCQTYSSTRLFADCLDKPVIKLRVCRSDPGHVGRFASLNDAPALNGAPVTDSTATCTAVAGAVVAGAVVAGAACVQARSESPVFQHIFQCILCFPRSSANPCAKSAVRHVVKRVDGEMGDACQIISINRFSSRNVLYSSPCTRLYGRPTAMSDQDRNRVRAPRDGIWLRETASDRPRCCPCT